MLYAFDRLDLPDGEATLMKLQKYLQRQIKIVRIQNDVIALFKSYKTLSAVIIIRYVTFV